VLLGCDPLDANYRHASARPVLALLGAVVDVRPREPLCGGVAVLSCCIAAVLTCGSTQVIRGQADPERRAGHGPSTGSRAAAIALDPQTDLSHPRRSSRTSVGALGRSGGGESGSLRDKRTLSPAVQICPLTCSSALSDRLALQVCPCLSRAGVSTCVSKTARSRSRVSPASVPFLFESSSL
jgi:hypothetical protein